ncbi:MAG: hypothetical protein M3Y87_23340 [Myxococcota bacterium]|nr:hypothetical protein [Myxococcota bacterium]
MEIAARLQELEAPPEITAWAASIATFDEAWESCPTSRHRVWLAGIAGIAVETIVESATGALFAHGEHEPALESFLEIVEDCVGADDAATCAALAERCDREAGAGAPYRDGMRHRAFARVASHVCRGFEALRSAESSMESTRMLRAQSMAGYMAGGAQAFLPADPGPLTLLAVAPASAERGLLVLAVASAAEAVRELVAVAGDEATWIDDAVWDALAPA